MKEQIAKDFIEVVKQFGKPVWHAAQKAAIVEGGIEVLFGLLFLVGSFVWLIKGCYFWARDEGDDRIMYIVVGGLFVLFTFLFLVWGTYDLLTIDYQAYKMLLP